MGLAIEAYSIAKESAIRAQQDAIAKLEAQRHVTKAILENAPAGIVRLDNDFICLEHNKEFLEILSGRAKEDVDGVSLFTIAPNLPSHNFEQVAATGLPFRGVADVLNFFTDSKRAPGFFDWAVWPVRDESGVSIGYIAIFTDVTNRVLLQQQREDFVATLTHDLKTPILAANRAIKCFIEGDFGPVPETQVTIMETILQSNDSLYRLVQTLLDVYKYDSGVKVLSPSETDLGDMVKKLVDELQALAASREITLTLNLPSKLPLVLCDPDELRRVFQNLLDNALKFTPSGGQIILTVHHNMGTTEVEVRDNGAGISEEDKPKLFQRFWAAAASGRYYASTGLGLYLCRKIVELHGGRIWCESKPGQGSTFFFTVKMPQKEEVTAK
jgi:PAS domain S-box-containing protein